MHLALFLLSCTLTGANLRVRALGFSGLLSQVERVFADLLALARPGTCPEASAAVVASGTEDVAERMPGERPDGEGMRVINAVGGPDGLGESGGRIRRIVGWDGKCGALGCVWFVEQVVQDAAVVAAGSHEVGVDGVPGESCDLFIMAAEEADVAHHAQVEDAGDVIAGTCGEELASVRIEGGFDDGVLVAVEGGEAAAGAGVPELDLVVFAAGDEEAFGGVPVDGFGFPAVAGDRLVFLGGGEVEDFQRGVVAGGDEFAVVGGEGEVADAVVVSLEVVDSIEVAIMVAYYALHVAADEPFAVVGVVGCSDGVVVGLK